MKQILHVMACATLFPGLMACGKDDVQPQYNAAQADMSTTITDMPGDASDMGRDALADASSSGCEVVEVTGDFTLTYSEGVAIEYEVAISPTVEGVYRNLTILFERYSPAADIGTFELGDAGVDANFGNCAHCLFMKGDTAARAYFASSGRMTNNADPYTRELDITVQDLIVVPVTVDGATRASTPIADAGCVQVKDFSVQRIFPAPGWTCEESRYLDGEACDCECGAPDPDCNGPSNCLPGDLECANAYEPLPVVGCEETEQCVFNPETMGSLCVSSCDWEARAPCASGTCLYEFGTGVGDMCVESDARFVDVAVDGDCPESMFQLFCALDGGFATGYCGPAGVCRAVCKDDSECAGDDETCRYFQSDDGLGYCGPPPPEDG